MSCGLLLLFVLWILLVVAVVAPPQGVYQAPIPIGAILDSEKDVVAKTGFLYAISTHNEQTRRSGKGMTFSTVVDELDVDDNFKFASRMCSQMAGGIFTFYGRISASSATIAQGFSKEFHMPFIVTTLAGAATMPYRPFSLYIAPSIVQAIVDLVIDYQWTRLDFIYDSDEGLYQIQTIHNKLTQAGHVTDINYCRLEDISNVHDDLRRLDRQNPNPVKNFIIDMSSHTNYKTLLSQIPEVGMNRAGYNYLLATMDIATLDLKRFRHGGVNISGFQLVNFSSPRVKNFLSAWSSLEPTVWPGAGQNKLELAAALSVDALEAFRRTLDQMVGRRHDVFHSTFRRGVVYNLNRTMGIPCTTRPVLPWMHGTEIYYSLRKVNFDGLTGQVAFDEKGYRRNYTLDVFTVSLDEGLHKTGEWHSEKGLLKERADTKAPVNVTEKSTVKIVSTILTKPFLMVRNMVDSSGVPPRGNDRYEGYCKDLAEELNEYLQMEYRLVPVADGEYGQELPNGTWTGIIGELIHGKADMAIAPLTITADRERVIDFAKPFMNVGISIMIKRPEKQKPGVFAFMEPFSIPLWSCIVISYVTVSVVVYLVAKFSPYEWRNRRTRYARWVKYNFTLCNSFWFSMGALMLQGSDRCPRSLAGRVVGGAWWFFVLIIITSYTANLAAFLTVERMLHPIESADDLAKQTDIAYGMVESGSTRKFFETSGVATYQKMWNYMSTAVPPVMVKTVEEGVERVRNSKGKYAFLIESSMNNYYNNRKPCDTVRVPGDLNLEGFGIATPHGSELKEMISYATLKMKEDGTLHRLETKWWYEKGECGTDTGFKESKKRSLSLSNVAGVFYILITGLVAAIILGLLEIFVYKNKRNKKDSEMARTQTQMTMAGTPQEQMNGLLDHHRTIRRVPR